MLNGLLLCVEEETDAARGGEIADLIDGVGEGLRWGEALGQSVKSLSACASESG